MSNCTLNLVTDLHQAMAECARVLRGGGRLSLTDMVATTRLGADELRERIPMTGHTAGPHVEADYRALLTTVGFEGVSVVPTHQIADGIDAAHIRAKKFSD